MLNANDCDTPLVQTAEKLLESALALRTTAALLFCFKNEPNTNKVFAQVQAEVKALRLALPAKGPAAERLLLHPALLRRIKDAMSFKSIPNR